MSNKEQLTITMTISAISKDFSLASREKEKEKDFVLILMKRKGGNLRLRVRVEESKSEWLPNIPQYSIQKVGILSFLVFRREHLQYSGKDRSLTIVPLDRVNSKNIICLSF